MPRLPTWVLCPQVGAGPPLPPSSIHTPSSFPKKRSTKDDQRLYLLIKELGINEEREEIKVLIKLSRVRDFLSFLPWF